MMNVKSFHHQELILHQIAAITQIISDKDITHVLVASDETGSGVASALRDVILKTQLL
jgi:ABC-type Zn uptake system ZnuABC Zn-binding protein ZnuA